jgi:hypothetical protein
MKALALSMTGGVFLGIASAVAVAYWGAIPHRVHTAWNPTADNIGQHLTERPSVSSMPSQQ